MRALPLCTVPVSESENCDYARRQHNYSFMYTFLCLYNNRLFRALITTLIDVKDLI